MIPFFFSEINKNTFKQVILAVPEKYVHQFFSIHWNYFFLLIDPFTLIKPKESLKELVCMNVSVIEINRIRRSANFNRLEAIAWRPDTD